MFQSSSEYSILDVFDSFNQCDSLNRIAFIKFWDFKVLSRLEKNLWDISAVKDQDFTISFFSINYLIFCLTAGLFTWKDIRIFQIFIYLFIYFQLHVNNFNFVIRGRTFLYAFLVTVKVIKKVLITLPQLHKYLEICVKHISK